MDDDARAAERRADAALVDRARADDPDAFGQLYDRWFPRVHDLAFRVTGESAAAADVAQDAFLSAWNNLPKLQDPAAFGGWLLRITRNAALDRRRREQRSNPYDADAMAMIEASGPSPANAPTGFRVEDRARAFDDPERAAEDSDLAALVWESAAALGERDSELLDLSLRHGLTPAEVGEVVGLNRNAANQAVHRVRGRLKSAIEARVLWRSGEPVCGGLVGALEGASISKFGAKAVAVISDHAQTCEECQERRDTRLEPSALFGAIPFIFVPMLLKMKIAHALSESGVPMDGSEAAAHDGDGGSHGRRRGRARRVATIGGVVVVAFIGVGVAADEVGEIPLVETSATGTKTTTLPSSTTSTAPATPSSTAGSSGSPSPPVFVPPPAPPSVTASISVSPATAGASHPYGSVRVTWGTSGGASVTVSGTGLSSTQASGNVPVCPGTRVGIRGSTCRANPGPHIYTVVVRDANGAVVAQSSATLTIS